MPHACGNCGRAAIAVKKASIGSLEYQQTEVSCGVLAFDGKRPTPRHAENNICDYYSPIGETNPLPLDWCVRKVDPLR